MREIFTPNPPAMALMAVPLAGLQPQPARSIWLLASILAYAAAIALLLRHAPLTSTRWLPVAVFLLLVNPPVLANLRLGQAYLFVAAGYALMASMVIRNRQPLAGAVSGVLFALKTTGGPLFLLLATTRRWRALTTGRRRDWRCDGSHRGPRRSVHVDRLSGRVVRNARPTDGRRDCLSIDVEPGAPIVRSHSGVEPTSSG